MGRRDKANASQRRALFKAEFPKKCVYTEFGGKNKRLSHASTQVFVLCKAKCKQTHLANATNKLMLARTHAIELN